MHGNGREERRPGRADAARLAAAFEARSPEELLRWALDRWHPGLAFVTAFQAEGMVLLDMAWRMEPEVRVLTLDTGRLPQETHDFIERVRERYRIDVEMIFPDSRRVESLIRSRGPNLFRRSVEERVRCCAVRKVEPLERALRSYDAWVTGLRRDQSRTRAGLQKVEIDARHGGIAKLSPLADWGREDVWAYLDDHRVPRHPYYDRGYQSLSCAPCVRPSRPGENPRRARWWWEADGPRECGIHHPEPLEAGHGR